MSALTIHWGEVEFENLGPFSGWLGAGGAGLFAVMVQPNAKTNPGDFRVVYFGEHDNLIDSEFFRSHPKFRCCVSEAGNADGLHFAIFPLPDSTAEQRKHIAKLLAEQFRPICNW